MLRLPRFLRRLLGRTLLTGSITETTVGACGPWSCGVSNIWEDERGILTAGLSFWTENTGDGEEIDARLGAGERVTLPDGIVVEVRAVRDGGDGENGDVELAWW